MTTTTKPQQSASEGHSCAPSLAIPIWRAPHVADATRNTEAEAMFLGCLAEAWTLKAEGHRKEGAEAILRFLPSDSLASGPSPVMSHPHLQEIFMAMVGLVQAGRDLLWPSVLDRLYASGATSRYPGAEWIKLFGAIEAEASPPSFAEDLARILIEKRNARALRAAYGSVSEAIKNGKEDVADAAVAGAREIMRVAASLRANGPVSAGQAFMESHMQIEQRAAQAKAGDLMLGLPIGLPSIDDAMRGMRQGNLIILAARPSVGKSTLAIQALYKAIVHRHGVLFFSLEMTRQEVMDKLISLRTAVPFEAIRNGTLSESQLESIFDTRQFFADAPLTIDDLGGQSIGQIVATAISHAASGGNLALIVIDYLQLLSGDKGKRNTPRHEEVAEVSRSLKSLAKTLNIPVLALAQLNRQIEQRTGAKKAHDRKPKLSDLRESGQIEQDADAVIFLNKESDGIREASCPKSRNARTVDWFPLTFDTRTCTFWEARKAGQ
jgi:replicative DNA helicase